MSGKVKVLKYLKPYAAYVVLAPLMMVLEVFMDLQQPALMAVVVNDGILGQDMAVVASACVKMLAAAIAGMIGGFGCTVFAMLAAMNYGTDVRDSLFRKTESFSFNEIDKFSTGSLVTRLTNDVTQMQNIISMALRMFVRSPLLCVGGIVMTLSISARYGIVLMICLPVIVCIILVVYKKIMPVFTALQKKLDRLNAILQENLAGVRVIKAFVRGGYEEARFEAANEDLTRTSLYAMNIMAVIAPIMMIIMNAVVLAVIYIGGYEVQAARMRVGDVMAAISYMTQILMSFMMMGMAFATIPRAKASADRIREVLETEPSITGGSLTGEITYGDITFEDVTFAYPGGEGEPVLKNISLHIKAGEHIGLLGSTGAGKSSLVNLIPRFYDVTGGRVLIDGTDVREYELTALRSRISFVLQEPVLFSGTMEENIKWGDPDAERDAVEKAASDAQAGEFIAALSDGYDSELGQRGLTLSGGQKQRACIARALIKQPKILILDDSTSSLDLGTEARMNAAIDAGYKDGTRLTIAQRIASVKGADRIYVLDGGVIAASGTHDELLAVSGLYRDIYESQMGQGAIT